jgi:invasion protein IalB
MIQRMIRKKACFSLTLVGVALGLTLATSPLTAASPAKPATPKRQKPATAAGPAGTAGKPELVATFGDWGVYVSQSGKSKICYALAQPKERQPANLKRDPAYIFISSRPTESVHNEVSVIMGFPLKEGGSDARAEVGSATFGLVAKEQNAWIKNAAEEGPFIGAMKKGSKLTIKAASKKGNVTTDLYSLSGLGPALDRVRKECP